MTCNIYFFTAITKRHLESDFLNLSHNGKIYTTAAKMHREKDITASIGGKSNNNNKYVIQKIKKNIKYIINHDK